MLVILYFMHARHSTKLTWLVIVASLVWLSLQEGEEAYSQGGKKP